MSPPKERSITRRGFMLGALGLAFDRVLPTENHPSFSPEKISSSLEQAYQQCLKDFVIGGQIIQLRIPFGWIGERETRKIVADSWGKANINQVWEKIAETVASEGFKRYIELLSAPQSKIIHLNLPGQKVTVIFDDQKLIERMKEIYSLKEKFSQEGNVEYVWQINRLYPGDDSQVYLLKEGTDITHGDVYDFLMAAGWPGIDCARFVYHCQQTIFGKKLDITLGERLGVPPSSVPNYIGSWFYRPDNAFFEEVKNRIADFQPGDVIQFRGPTASHSAIIQSVDLKQGLVKYLQCTDFAEREERGVYNSYIVFNPEHLEVSLGGEEVVWKQKIYPTFPGEQTPIYWRNDGDRYRKTSFTIARLRPDFIERLFTN